MPRVCAEWGYATDRQPLYDSCYPALGSLLVRPFPFEAGHWFIGLGILLWAGALLALERGRRGLMAFGICLGSSIVLYAVERGNPIVYAAAGSLLFVAWMDSKSSVKRFCALVALALAAALKIVPAVLIVLLIARWRGTAEGEGAGGRAVLGEAVLFALAGTVLFFGPFVWCGGWSGFLQWLSNAAGNASHYSHTGAWGFVAIGRTVRAAALHVDVSQPWPGLVLERLVNAVWGMGCLGMAIWCMWKRNLRRGDGLLLVTAAMLLVPGNMHFYAGIYLLPVLVLRLREGMGWLEAVCWFTLLCPLQIPFGAGCLNHPLANLAFMALVGLTMARCFRLQVQG